MAIIITLNGLFLPVLSLCVFCTWAVFDVASEKIPENCHINHHEHMITCHDAIPVSLPFGVEIVELENFRGELDINQTTFAGNGWRNISNLTITNISPYELYTRFRHDCFSTLDSLIELHIHARPVSMNGPFGNLANLTLLDLSNCATLTSYDFLSIFNSSTTLPSLEKLVLHKTGSSSSDKGLVLSSEFFKHLSKRPVAFIDLSSASIRRINMTALSDFCPDKLIRFSVRHLFVGQIISELDHANICNKLQVLDMSYLRTPNDDFCAIPPMVDVSNITMGSSSEYTKLVSRAETVYASYVCDKFSSPIIFRNVTKVHLKPTQVVFDWKFVYFNHNYVHYLDIEILCNSSSTPLYGTKELSLNSNGLEFVHPSIHYCLFRNVEKLDLSDNNLNEMFLQNPTQFKNVFWSLPMLRVLNLSSNGFDDKTDFNFVNNTELEVINLSRNLMSTFRLNIYRNRLVRILDISKNKIVELNREAIKSLNALLYDGHKKNIKLNLSGNPFNCFGCAHYQSIQWIYKNSDHLTAYDETKCSNENHLHVSVTKDLVEHLGELCQRPIRVRNAVIGVSVSAGFIISLVIVIISIRKVQKRKANRLIRDDFLDRLREASEGYEFLAFLSYSSDDEAFIGNHVLPPLQETVSHITGIERPLMCTGDVHFRIGYPIHNEMVSCLRRSAVVVIVLSDAFLRSHFCQLEFQLAFQQGKPVLIMVKEKVNTDLMSPAMNEHFRNLVRVHWEDVGGGLVLKCSWEHVGQCLISVGSEGRLWQK